MKYEYNKTRQRIHTIQIPNCRSTSEGTTLSTQIINITNMYSIHLGIIKQGYPNYFFR